MSFIISTSVSGKTSRIRLCQECATEAKTSVKHGIPDARRGSGIAARECLKCHSGYTRSTLLGCPMCYTEFAGTLTPFLRRIHGSIIHRGKVPVQKTKRDAGTRRVASLPRLRAPTDLRSLYGRGAPCPYAEAEWMQGSGPDCDVVISSRIRLARNISGHIFCNLASAAELQHIAATVEGAVADVGEHVGSPLQDTFVIRLEHLNAIDREFLIERHLISRDLAERNGTGKVIVGEKEVVSIMLNEEDHIRLQVINPGLQLRQSWEMINDIDDELGRKIDYAFSPNWGYLTACPTNVGTGLRVSVMLHIPALAAASGWQGAKNGSTPMLRAVSDMGYAVRGMYGEGSQATGAFYQISNEAALGQSEEEIVDRIRSVARQIVDREREERRLLIEKNRIKAEDKIFRSYGTLISARLISSSEALDLLSWVSLGVNTGILSEPSRTDIARLLVLTRPAHLQKYEGRKLDTAARDISRAAVIRNELQVTSDG